MRRCGSCNACCVYLPIPAGEVSRGPKPAGTPCPRLRAGGCEIYAERPALCHSFSCAWLGDTNWPESWRPDRSGLLCLREAVDEGVVGGLIYEVVPAKLRSSFGRRIQRQMLRTCDAVVVVDSDGNRQLLAGERSAGRPHGPDEAPLNFVAAARRRVEGIRRAA